MNPEELQQTDAPEMTEEQMMQQEQQDQQLAASGADPENGEMPEEDMEQDPNALVPDGEGQLVPWGTDEMQAPENPDPMDALAHLVLSYMDYAIAIKENPQLDEQTRSAIMLQQAQSINYFVPLLRDDKDMEMMQKRQEMDMKYQEHQMNMEMKQAEMEMKKQEMEMKMQQAQMENQLKLQFQQQTNQQKIEQNQMNHEHKVAQSQESHETKMQQAKQAAQLKQSSNQSNDKAKPKKADKK